MYRNPGTGGNSRTCPPPRGHNRGTGKRDRQMSTAQVERWLEIARGVFPDGAQITHPPAGESVWLKVRWKLGTDPLRPQKPARSINIYFTREFCKTYASLDAPRQAEWDEKVRGLLAGKFAAFNPEHNAPHGAPVPGESWFVTPGAVQHTSSRTEARGTRSEGPQARM